MEEILPEIRVDGEFLDRLEALAEKASGNMWSHGDDMTGEKNIFADYEDGHSIHSWHIACATYAGTVDDAAYIAAVCPHVLKALIKRIRELESKEGCK